MEKILMTPEGKKVKINPREDQCLYDAPHNPPNTGTRYTAGTDLFVHKARSGTLYFYEYHWSMWQGTEPSFNLITDQEARDFVLRKAGMGGHDELGPSEKELAESIWPNLFEEDA